MIQNKKIEMLQAWGNPFAELSISEIMKACNKKTKPWVFNTLKLLVKNNLLMLRNKGDLNLYRLNLKNPFLIQSLQYLESQNNLNFPKMEIITDIINNIPIKNHCLLVFGSYAKGKQRRVSDIDICFLVKNKLTKRKIKPYLNDIKISHTIEIDDHYITFRDFVKMLLRDEENLAKQIFRNHIIFFNSDIYYQILKEAYKNGFRQ